MLDTIGDFGGIVQVIAFVVYATMNLYHDVVMEQYVLNQAILQKDLETVQKDFNKAKSNLTLNSNYEQET